ncbi:hypothetical protein [Sedimentitalea todarodis]|uniref:Uncharacterized protein n=1 Tax=Sedimentitalea todarodis TaxID=1631240 RepID=A0ABU3VEJ1_9RHOB|nr:hypothetical protein [Sedimentitalea todarodis]MDU9004591.1 hypothetical protein [Sedimentitalea todarodis]
MTTIHSTISNDVFPTELTDPNKIVTEYQSYTLIPRLGPLSYAYIKKAARRRLWYMNRTLVLLNMVATYKATWKVKPDLQSLALGAMVTTGHTAPGVNTDPAIVRRVPTSDERRMIGPRVLMNNVRRLPDRPTAAPAGGVVAASPMADLRIGLQSESDRDILGIFRESNPVIDRLVATGRLLDDKGDINDELVDMDPMGRLSAIIEAAPAPESEASAFISSVSKSVTVDALAHDRSLSPVAKVAKANSALQDRVAASVADSVAQLDMLMGVATYDDAPIVDSREWAFLRRERVEILLSPPKFRGPLSVNSVAPNSELTLTDSQSTTSQTFDISASQSARTSGQNMLISNQIREKLGTLHDFGSNLGQTMSEQGYEKDNSKGEKRTIIEQTLSEISETNAATTISSSTVGASSVREYKTRGNDTNFATTEVSFEVFSSVQVTHFLDGIGAVWCPRIKNPYGMLRQTINDYEAQVRSDYVVENHVTDPAEPLPTYEGFAPVPGDAKKISGDDIEDDTEFTYLVTIALRDQDKAQGYFLDDNVTYELIQESEWDENELDADQYDILPPVVKEYVPNSHITIETTLKVHEEPWGWNPSWVWVRVTVNKFKYTASYLQQLEDYMNTVGQLNPARRSAVEAQAKRYARLKKEELIRRYADNPAELREYTFIALMRQMFGNGKNWSYYHGIIKTCINWDRAQIQPEPAKPEHLAADGLSPFHFLNVVAVRFFLPIHEGSEDAFFEAVSNTLDTNWKQLFAKVKTYVDLQRDKVDTMTERMNEADIQELTLDAYDSELVLGRHLEAVLSKTTFLES